jgi:hypothetical protein
MQQYVNIHSNVKAPFEQIYIYSFSINVKLFLHYYIGTVPPSTVHTNTNTRVCSIMCSKSKNGFNLNTKRIFKAQIAVKNIHIFEFIESAMYAQVSGAFLGNQHSYQLYNLIWIKLFNYFLLRPFL